MAVFRTKIRSDLQKPLVVQQLSGNMFTADNASNEIAVEVTNGGEPVALSGAVTAYAVRADGVTAMFSGTISGNVASVVLPASCYVEVGTLSIVIKVGTTTVGACTCYVYRTTTDEIVDPGHVIPSIDELLEQIEACRTATVNANTAATNANTAASNANAKAALADEKATLADQKATSANTAAQNADTKAGLANDAATLANTKAGLADTAAQNAAAKATLANTAAENANTKAGLANDAATLANTKAALADEKATLANTKAELANTAAQNADDKAELADTAAQNADDKAELAETAATNANTKAGLANEAATLANTKAALADEKANLADTKATLADTAATNANAKAGLADTAAQNADAKATLANDAATLANTKAGLADTAATNANTAAGKIDNMTVAASGLPEGSAPIATISEVDGHKHVLFQIPKGDKGKDFHIAKTFASVAAMMAYTGTDLEKYDFAMIDTGSVEDPDTGKLYCYEPDKNPKWSYIGDLSGAQGIKGETGTGIDHVSLNADYTLTVYYDDGTSNTTTSIRGATGITPNIAVGTVTTLLPDQQAYVTRDPSSTAENPVFNFGIPKGDTGAVDNVYGTNVPMSESDSTTVAEAIGGKADKVQNATAGNFAGLDANGNLTDSGSKPSDFLTQHQDISGKLDKDQGSANAGKFMKVGSDGKLVPDNVPDPTGKADKVSGATNGNFAGLDANGNLTDSGKSADDFLNKKYESGWKTKTWSGLTDFSRDYLWTDGENIYYSYGSSQYVLDKSTSTWTEKSWGGGFTNFDGLYIWTDGENIYYSRGSIHCALDKSTSAWTTKTWSGLNNFYGSEVWMDGKNIYYSYGSDQYVLDKSISTWSTKTWSGLTDFSRDYLWTDGENIYYSYGSSQYVLDKSTSTWTEKSWGGGFTNFDGLYIWTDGENIYYSRGSIHCALDKSTSAWTTKTWSGLNNFYGSEVWTDGDNIYYSSGSDQYVLDNKPKLYLGQDGEFAPVSVKKFIDDNVPSMSKIVDLIYPVGSIYMSVASTSPATLFDGTTWEQLKSRFLLGTDDEENVPGTYPSGSIGGANSVSYTPEGTNSGGVVGDHTLTVDEIPSHNHTFTGNAVNTGNQSAGHTHKYTDYYATTTGGTAITAAQMAGISASVAFRGVASSYGIIDSTSGNASHSTASADLSTVGLSGSGRKDTLKIAFGANNSHTHGGSNTHSTRTSEGISANHTHSVTASGSIGNEGGGVAHNHGFTQPTFTGTEATINTMPPYLAVYMWKRTA